jgi:hypothetical protein
MNESTPFSVIQASDDVATSLTIPVETQSVSHMSQLSHAPKTVDSPMPTMTEIIVTVDPHGAIMGVDTGSASGGQTTFVPIKTLSGHTTLVPLTSAIVSKPNNQSALEYALRGFDVQLHSGMKCV